MAKMKGVNNPSQKRGTGAESQAEAWIMGGCELVSSARGSRNLLAPSRSSREQVEKFHEENLFEEIYRNKAFHNRAGWYLGTEGFREENCVLGQNKVK